MGGTAVGFIADHSVDVEFLSCLLGLLHARHDDIQGRVIQARGYAGRLDVGRSTVFEAFLRGTDAEYLLCLDSDMVFTVEDYDRLKQGYDHASEPTVLSGLYMQVDGRPCVFRKNSEGALANVDPSDLMGKRYFAADSAGLGFTLVHRGTLDAIREMMGDYPLPFSDNTAKGDAGQPLADDSSFFHRCQEAGYELYVDTKTRIGHIKQVVMYPKIESKLQIATELPR